MGLGAGLRAEECWGWGWGLDSATEGTGTRSEVRAGGDQCRRRGEREEEEASDRRERRLATRRLVFLSLSTMGPRLDPPLKFRGAQPPLPTHQLSFATSAHVCLCVCVCVSVCVSVCVCVCTEQRRVCVAPWVHHYGTTQYPPTADLRTPTACIVTRPL